MPQKPSFQRRRRPRVPGEQSIGRWGMERIRNNRPSTRFASPFYRVTTLTGSRSDVLACRLRCLAISHAALPV